MAEVLRYTAFSADPSGGNPAGVVLDASGLDADAMLAVAAEVGFSETAFLVPRGGGRFDVRYFSPRAEVSFCGHATIASAVAFAERSGERSGEGSNGSDGSDGDLLVYATPAGEVEVRTARAGDGSWHATLTSVPTTTVEPSDGLVELLLEALRWSPDDLDPALPVRVAYAGAWHPIVAARSRRRLADLDYDLEGLAALMDRQRWTTVDLVWRESDDVFHARNPFPPGGVVEDPATGAAAAAFGGYLRELELLPPDGTFTVVQGVDLGRPSLLRVDVPLDPHRGVDVSGTAVPLPA